MKLIPCDFITPSVEQYAGDIAIVCPTHPEPTAVLISVKAADELIAALGRTRESMEPAVPSEMPQGAKVEVVPNFTVSVWADQFSGHPMYLSVRDPRFGWLHYQLPREMAFKVAKDIQREADKTPETSRRPS